MTEANAPSPVLEAVYRGDDTRLRQLLAERSSLDVFEAAARGHAAVARRLRGELP